MGIDIVSFWKNICRMSVGLIIPVALGVLSMLYIEISSKWVLLGLIVGYTLIYCISMWLLGLNKYEKDLILKVFKKVKRK